MGEAHALSGSLVVPRASKELEENYALAVAEHLALEFAVLVLGEWSGALGPLPPGVMSPRQGGQGASLEAEQVSAVCQGKQAVLVPCTFESQDEEWAMQQLMPVLSQNTTACIVVLQLVPQGTSLNKQTSQVCLLRHGRIVACNPDNVVFNPRLDPGALRSAVTSACAVSKLNAQRAQVASQQAGPRPDQQEIARLEDQLQSILWVGIARVLMTHIPRINPHLHEVPGQSIGPYRLVTRFHTRSQSVYRAVEAGASKSCVVKVVEKKKVMSPCDLEGIYREFVLMANIIDHPHIIKCLGCLHTPNYFYIRLEDAGPLNLLQYLEQQPGARLGLEDAHPVLRQIASAVAYCHGNRIAHRDLALEHVVADSFEGGGACCRLVDFRSAIVVNADAVSRTRCGTLPCIAPEVLAGEAYMPRLADRWSLGVIVLEVAGGVSSMERAVHFTDNDSATAQRIRQFFSQAGSHTMALAMLGGVSDQAIVEMLEQLLQPDPATRGKVASTLLDVRQ